MSGRTTLLAAHLNAHLNAFCLSTFGICTGPLGASSPSLWGASAGSVWTRVTTGVPVELLNMNDMI